jgi:predicted SnoaL-like aldol condensation-catalyzing enzyme
VAKTFPLVEAVDALRYLIEGRPYGRPVAWIAADIVRIENGRLAEHWDVLQDEATKAESKSGLPMFGATFPTYP